MSRSKWKIPYINPKYIKQIKEVKKQHNIMKISRNSEIIPKFLNLIFKIHNGKNYIEISVTEDMIGHKFGEFVSTREKFSFKKKKSKK